MAGPQTIETIMDRVGKLLRLARSDNPHEAAVAASRAHELMVRYEIGEAAIELDEPLAAREAVGDFSDTDPLERSAHVFPRWKLTLVSILCASNQAIGTVIRDESGKRIGIIGRPSDVAKVRYMYAWLSNEVGELSAAAGKGRGRTWANNFRMGFVEGFGVQLRDATERAQSGARAAATGSRALVRVDEAIEQIAAREREVAEWMQRNRADMGRMRAKTGAATDYGARYEGRQAGADFDLGARVRLGSAKR